MTITAHTTDPVRLRYGGDAGTGPTLPVDEWNDVLRTQLGHRSVRAFRPDPVAEPVLSTILVAAQSAPTSSNLQPWSVVVVTDPERKRRLATAAGNQDFIAEAPVFLVWLADYARIEQLGASLDRPTEGLEFTDSALIAFVDAALAAQNATLAAESLGLGTVFVGAVRNRPEAFRTELSLPHRVFPLFGTAIGHPDPDRPAQVKPRLPLGAVVHRERYDLDAQVPAATAYEETIGRFYAEAGLAHSWRDRVTARLAGRDSLKGRDRIRQALEAAGFPLR
ncbi:NADPH-dependent oxidoreductase [Microlunatus sp. GCM10028923]|uniref:NADPH-dependent oxidoreductase n=1 Tax=Microlunatus sp. GCM10028923 TaxID=3273400 RepID=UPI00361E1416